MFFKRLQELELFLLIGERLLFCFSFVGQLFLFLGGRVRLQLLFLLRRLALALLRAGRRFQVAVRPVHELGAADFAVIVLVELNQKLVIRIFGGDRRWRKPGATGRSIGFGIGPAKGLGKFGFIQEAVIIE